MSSLSVIYVLAIYFTKISISLLYLRILGVHQTFTVFVKGGIVFLTIYYAASFGLSVAQLMQCAQASALSNSLCAKTQSLTLFQSVLNVLTDLYVLALPIAPLMQLNMRRGKKLGVLILFLSGSM